MINIIFTSFSISHIQHYVLALLFLSAFVEGASTNAEVKRFPGFDGQLPSKHYAGYITVGNQADERHLYYYFASSERNPLEDPLTIWINGGPGCAGIGALVQLVGPFKIDYNQFHIKGQAKLKQNPFSWTKVSSVLFVDSPVGVGYSYADTSEGYVTNDSDTISDLYEFVIKWFSEYPEFLPNPLYLAACSYSGVIVPVLAQEIVNGIEAGRGPTINFKGYSLGNAANDIDVENNAMVPYAYRVGLISDELYKDLVDSCNGKYWDKSHPDCQKNLEIFQTHIEGMNKEHILFLPCHFQMGLSLEDSQYENIRMYENLEGRTEYSIYCHIYELIPERLFDAEDSRQALHAMPVAVSGPWKRCTKRIRYERNILSLTPYHLNLTMKGYRAFFYSGDHDMVMPYTATLQWIRTFNYSVIEKWHPWFVENQIAGYAIRFDHNLLFATFKGAGHTVTEYMPREALIAYQKWIDGAESL
ncbi:serine carboxypeptidase 1 [Phoenix dactylifera]|uniref:Serine carboxypeptidase 1 n=1 Tax=Phoenix dactylifera TaxID=42345 RepID=A0A8B7CHG1_PHODC|nr:serine carboxypeptidase 1 [Phoenix dactylifera]